MREWIEKFRAVGRALLEVYRAEMAELSAEMAETGRHFAWAAGFLLAAAMVAFWTVAALGYFLIQVLALWLPLWGAAGVVVLLLVLIIALLAFLGYRRLGRCENPTETVRRRLDDHRAWMEGSLLPPEIEVAADDDDPVRHDPREEP